MVKKFQNAPDCENVDRTENELERLLHSGVNGLEKLLVCIKNFQRHVHLVLSSAINFMLICTSSSSNFKYHL